MYPKYLEMVWLIFIERLNIIFHVEWNLIFQNGKFAVVGTYDGRCIFYLTDTLKYHTMIHVRSSRGKNSQGRKVTGIEPMPGEDKVCKPYLNIVIIDRTTIFGVLCWK